MNKVKKVLIKANPDAVRLAIKDLILSRYNSLVIASKNFGKCPSYFHKVIAGDFNRLSKLKTVEQIAEFLNYDMYILFVPKEETEKFKKLSDKYIEKTSKKMKLIENLDFEINTTSALGLKHYIRKIYKSLEKEKEEGSIQKEA